MIFNSNQERAAYWKHIQEVFSEEEIDQALASLKPQTRISLQMRYVEGRSFQEIADALGRSISIVRNHHNRGVFLLHKYLSKNDPAEKNTDQLEKKFSSESFASGMDR